VFILSVRQLVNDAFIDDHATGNKTRSRWADVSEAKTDTQNK